MTKKAKLKAGLASFSNIIELNGSAVCGTASAGKLLTGLSLPLFFSLLGAGISDAQRQFSRLKCSGGCRAWENRHGFWGSKKIDAGMGEMLGSDSTQLGIKQQKLKLKLGSYDL